MTNYNLTDQVNHDALAMRVQTIERILATTPPTPGEPPPSEPPPVIVTNPGKVTDLQTASPTDTTLALRFTEVDDGTGHPAKYSVRAAPNPMDWGNTPNTLAVAGQAIGQIRDFQLAGLQPNTRYDIQLIPFRGTLNVDAVFGGLSNIAQGTTTSVVTAPPSAPPPIASGAAFASDWSTALGIDPLRALRDGGRWDWEADWGGGKLMSVVAGIAPGGRNALKVIQRGGSFSCFIGKRNVVPVSTDYYVRYYMRNDDTSSAGDHIVVPDFNDYGNLTYMRKYGSSAGWQFDISLYGVNWIYPISHIGPTQRLLNGKWYRFEYHVDFVDATHVQVHVRVYDENNVLLFDDKDFRQEALGSQVWNGRSDWSLASLYASGFKYAVDPAALTQFAMGNNGNRGAVDTGLPWYFAGLEIRTDRWPGP